MAIVSRLVATLAAFSTVITFAEPAFSAVTTVPGPLLGAGIPGLVIGGAVMGGIWLTRKLRNR